jgi:hypothetical protein
MGLSGDVPGGVGRFLQASSEMEARYWIGRDVGGNDQEPYFNYEEICNDIRAQIGPFCWNAGSRITDYFEVPAGDFVLSGHAANSVLMQYFPTVEPIDSGLARITLGAAKDNKIVLAGLDARTVNNVAIYDAASGTHRTLLNSASEMEFYKLENGSEPGKVLFTGLRFSNNEYVFGSIDVNSGVVQVLANTGQRWQDFDAFE